ncbi:tetratricopeptide repeat protein [Pelagicoccus sp. SDUM812002]|uniref:tetratricopeptide repeat protein n=1 Tax=Pelagicoccus sp. SDUM812002 TaxID=3041266 RepID=UPI0028108A52|nr:tetratricopeptide repeat protein [Pelagicoccus sp. SDUM812002]MDQ8184332.1 tetratricopeptide repeat protein [Pelagicoccus sp. SDUM812002]
MKTNRSGILLVAVALWWAFAASTGLQATEISFEEALSLPERIDRLPALQYQVEQRLDLLREDPTNEEAIRELAYLYHANGFVDKATAIYDWLIERSESGEKRARLSYLAADAVKEKGELVAVEQYLEMSTSDFRQYPLAFARLGEAELKSGDLEEAETHFRAALSQDEEISMARLGVSRIHETRGELVSAMRELETLLSYEPDNYNAQALMVRVLAQLKEDDQVFDLGSAFSRSRMPPVEDLWVEVLRDYMFDPQRLDFIFLDYFTVGDYERALTYLDRMQEIDPDNARFYRYRGTVLMEEERFDQASVNFRKGIELGGDDAESYPLLVQSLGRGGAPDEAEAVARKGLQDSEPTAALLLELARLLVDREANAEAMEALSKAHEIDPYDVEVLLLRARVGMWLDSPEEAKRSLAMVRQLAPSDAEKLVRAALVFMEAGIFVDALPLLERAVKVKPGYKDGVELLADAHLQIGGKLLAAGDGEAALASLDRSLEILPNSIETLMTKSQLLINMNRFQDAERTMRQLIQNGAVNPTILLIYGDLLYKNGRPDEARATWQRALDGLGTSEQPKGIRANLLKRLNS